MPGRRAPAVLVWVTAAVLFVSLVSISQASATNVALWCDAPAAGYMTATFGYDASADGTMARSVVTADVVVPTEQLENPVLPAVHVTAHLYDPFLDLVAPGSLADDLLGAACSFAGETEVLLADGTTKPISEIEVGDMVLAEDPETGERGPREVTHLWVHQDTIIDLEIGGHDVATTEDHPFWNQTDSEWQRADALDPRDSVLTAGGRVLGVEGLDWESARTTTAYNFTVDDIHTYFVRVGNHEVLVHNSKTCDNLWQLTREGAESTRRHGRFGTFYETVNRHGESTSRVRSAGTSSFGMARSARLVHAGWWVIRVTIGGLWC